MSELARRPRMPRLLRLFPPFFLSSLFLLMMGVSLKGRAIWRDAAPSSCVPTPASTSMGVVSRTGAAAFLAFALGAGRLAGRTGSSVVSSTTSIDPRGLRSVFLVLGTASSSGRPGAAAAAAAVLEVRLGAFLGAVAGAGADGAGGGEDARRRPPLCLDLAGPFFIGADSGGGEGGGSSDVLTLFEPRVKWKSPSCSS